ncbi:hypothetical protein [Streptomyces sp. NPDC047079]|uniref:hypothetical protein n=1 Tax=Streptomyces sp. NPDC047079 TaxID=3154607 RepID=UPI0033DB9B82
MSTVLDKAPAVTSPVRAGRHPAAAVLALARFEARELMLQIPVFVFFLLYIGSALWKLLFPGDGMDEYPVLHSVDRDSQSLLLFLSVAVLVCVNVAVLRSRRHGTDGQFDVLAMEPWRRTVAHALSVVPFAAVTALVVAVQFDEPQPGSAVALTLAVGTALALLLPERWALFVAADSPGWAAAHQRWAAMLALTLPTGAGLLPEPLRRHRWPALRPHH